MHLVYANPSRNALHLIMVGALDKADGDTLLEDARRALALLSPGFSVLTDLRDLRSEDQEASHSIRNLMDMCKAHGAKRVVRIVSKMTENFGFTLMSYFHYDKSVSVMTVLNLEDALRFLESE